MPDRLHLPDRWRRQIKALLVEHVPDAEVWAYGSRADGTSHDASDLDLVLRGPGLEQIPIGQLGDLRDALDKSNIPILVDFHDWTRLPESFHKEIERRYVVVQTAPTDGQARHAAWTSIRLGDACTKIGSGATPTGGNKTYVRDGPYALIRSQNVHNDGFRHQGLVYVDERQARKLNNVEVRSDDILLNITGDSVARSCQVDSGILPARVNQHVTIIRTDRTVLSPSFLRYALINPNMQQQLLSLAGSGGTRKALTKQNIESLIISAPHSIEHQAEITSTLEILDSKIELNRRMSKTLKAMAQALFKSWFIDFDPVRAKMEGRDTGLPDHIADLFPDRLANSSLGLIPECWSVAPFSKIVYHLRETEDPRDSPDALFSHYSIPAHDSSLLPTEQSGRSIKSRKTILNPGAVLISRLNPEIERVWLPHIAAGERAVSSTEFMALVPKRPFTSSYLSCFAHSSHFRSSVVSLVTGTSKSHQRAPAKDILSLSIPVPPGRIAVAFDEYAGSMLERDIHNRAEALSLLSLRDLLLPELVTGNS